MQQAVAGESFRIISGALVIFLRLRQDRREVSTDPLQLRSEQFDTLGG